ncbi:MAG: LamG domain-containing protein [Planctomycetaceae bacterium]|nr:LamG domain-containing protein [Planctomycetaceae bacterium]
MKIWHRCFASFPPSVRFGFSLMVVMSCSPVLVTMAQENAPADLEAIKSSLYFHAPFDGGTDAKVARQDRQLYTAPNLQRLSAEPGQHREDVKILVQDGKHGDALRFLGKDKQVLFYRGSNLDFRETAWQGTVSLWLRLTPDEDLKEGYSDPLQITDKAWNDASFFIDFDIDSPRTFRLGVFSEFKFWNPDNVKWEDWPIAERPMLAVPRPPMQRDRWTHVAWTFEGINATDGQPATCKFYLDGKAQGAMGRPLKFAWNLERTAIMLGLDYIGDLDELMIFDRALSESEVARLTTFFNEE